MRQNKTRLVNLVAALLILVWASLSGAQSSQTLLPVPALSGRVVDLTASLTAQQQAEIEQKLREFEESKGSQIAVLIVPATAPESIEQFALRVAEQWKLGRKKIDDGAILVIAKNERALRIEVGYGLEGVLNDATAKRIIEERIVPRFKQDDFQGGISSGIDAMLGVINGEPLPAPAARDVEGDSTWSSLAFLAFIGVLIGGIMRGLFGRARGALATGTLLGVVVWLIVGLISSALVAAMVGFVVALLGGRMGGGHLGGMGSGRSDTWGGHGGFRGGGGDFGGGGASGKW
jgi:uncharacterized protein